MPSFRVGTVDAVLAERTGLQRVAVDVDGERRRAYALTQLTGAVAVGDRVVLNTTAVALGLGTGGWDVVHWNLAREHGLDLPGGGHIMKLRYTSLQADTGAAEEHDPDLPDSLDGLPVVVCSLHSQVAAVAAGFRSVADPSARLVYVMTDGAALPLALSDLVASLRERRWLHASVTAGHAFGGDVEAVTVASALAFARHRLSADAVVVAMGPGVVGTGSSLGTTALEVASIVDTANALSAAPIAVLRVSTADPRERHQGVSHHSQTALLRLAHTGARIPVPVGRTVLAPGGPDAALAARFAAVHEVVEVAVPDTAAAFAAAGLRVTTMGRGPDEEPDFFAFAAAGGVVAAQQARRLAGR